MAPKAAKEKVVVSVADWNRQKATPAAVRRFEELYAKSSGAAPVRGGEPGILEVIPSGSIALDYALGIGGYPRGMITQTWGLQDSGKTSLALLATASAQRTYPDQMCGWVDVESTLDKGWARELGVDLARL